MEKIAERNTYFLLKESFSDFPSRIEKRCFELVREQGDVTDEDFICMDEVDVAKPDAEKMEGLSVVRDGSTGELTNGYLFHGASIRGIPVMLEQEDLGTHTKNQVWRGMIERMVKQTQGKGIYLLDAYYEIASYMDLLVEKKCSFIVRAKRGRVWIDEMTGETKKLHDFPCGIHRVRIPDREYTLTLHVKQYEGFNEPMRVVTNMTSPDGREQPDVCKTYFKRWEIEQVFRTMKQEFQLEKIRAQSLTVTKNIVAMVQLAVALSNAVFNARNQFRNKQLFNNIDRFERQFKKYARYNGLTMNRNSIVTFIGSVLTHAYRKSPDYIERKMYTREPGDPAQLKLFTVVRGRKSGEV